MTTYFTELESPIGPITILSDGAAITRVTMQPAAAALARSRAPHRDDARLAEARAQLTAYFAGALRVFSLPLAPRGTTFQQRVWAMPREIPFGQTTSYGALATALGRAGSARGRSLVKLRTPRPPAMGAMPRAQTSNVTASVTVRWLHSGCHARA